MAAHDTDTVAITALGVAVALCQHLVKKGMLTNEEFGTVLNATLAQANPVHQKGVEALLRELTTGKTSV